jgi:histidine triad (HIT) family protein
MEDTVFDKIIRREIPAEIVYEDEHTLAFLDAHPNNPGHTLVIPKKQVVNIFDIDEETLMAVWRTVRKVAHAVKAATGTEGLNITSNNGAVAGQVVFHYHVHVIPRFPGDGMELWHGKEYEPGVASAVAVKIREALKD